MTLIETKGLTKHFAAESGFLSQFFSDKVVHAVDSVNLSIEQGSTVGLVGESGCGKSTLGRTLLRLVSPTDGQILFEGEDITELSQRELRPYRKDLQMVFQDPAESLNPRKTVGEILTKPLEFHDIAHGEEANQRAATLLEDVGLQRSYLDRYPHEFSGGQQQRIGIARALSVDPKFIVLDEPVSALDVSIQSQILNLIQNLQNEFNLTILFVTHDLNVIRHVCDEVAVMYLGEIVERADVDELFDNPYHPYTKALLESILTPDANVDKKEIKQTLSGDVPSPIDPPSGCRFRTRCPEVMNECATTNPELTERLANDGQERMTSCHLYDPVGESNS